MWFLFSESMFHMNKTQLTQQLRATADVLKPLTTSVTSGASIWDGTEYVKAGAEKQPDPYALAWWFTLIAIADFIDAQETPLCDKQMAFLERMLFGGMGSLTDLSFDPKSLGEVATTVNGRLEKQTQVLWSSLKDE